MIKGRLKRKKGRVFPLLHLLLDLRITFSSGARRFLETPQGSLDKLPCLLRRLGCQGRGRLEPGRLRVGVSLESSAAGWSTARGQPRLSCSQSLSRCSRSCQKARLLVWRSSDFLQEPPPALLC